MWMRIPTPRLLAIDLGTSKSRIWSSVEGYLAEIPSNVLVSKKNSKPVIADASSSESIPTDYVLVSPLREGRASSLTGIEVVCKALLEKIKDPFWKLLPSALCLNISSQASQVEKTELLNCCYKLGFKTTILVPQILAAAVGSDINLNTLEPSVILSLGEGVSELGIISLGSLVKVKPLLFSGSNLKEMLSQAIYQDHGVVVKGRAIEYIVKAVDLDSTDSQPIAEIVSPDTTGAHPRKSLILESKDVRQYLFPILERLVEELNDVINHVDQNQLENISNQGLILVGGLAQLKGLSNYLSNELEIPVSVPQDPEHVVISGLSDIMKYVQKNSRFDSIVENVLGL